MNKVLFSFFFLLLCNSQTVFAQKKIAITIDDVPNTAQYHQQGKSALLQTLDSLNIPAAIFINEGLLEKNGDFQLNKDLLKEWIFRPYITSGNHTKNHSRYSTVGYDAFTNDIKEGYQITDKLLKSRGKSGNYFRFPFNDLGKDSTEHIRIREYLNQKKYVLSPHTVESSDWMFNAVYEFYLEKGDSVKAAEIGKRYVDLTIKALTFFDSLSGQVYGRSIKHIYLCHDNPLNAHYLGEIVQHFSKMDYDIVPLSDVLTDDLYLQKDSYYQKWGISWLYRWMKDEKVRQQWMRIEPEDSLIAKEYDSLTAQ
ncbi:polysaccharide deacetylase [bacterium]|nr:MAG: polysaccharide deacetylase [bacterium]